MASGVDIVHACGEDGTTQGTRGKYEGFATIFMIMSF